MTARHDSDPDLNEDDIPDASELLDFELIAKSQPDKGQGVWLWVVLVLILGGGGWAGWMYMQDATVEETVSADGVPTIMAPKFDLREKPTDPGGMDVPDRDKLVYGRMAGEGGPEDQGVERLLPPPETPLEPPESAVQPDAAEPYALQPDVPQSLAPQSTEPKAVVDMPPPVPSAPMPEAPVAAAPEAVPAAPEPAPEVASEAAPEPAAAPTSSFKATGSAGKGFLVQLSAVRTEEAAKTEWARFVKKYPDVLGGLEPVILRADLGAKGIYYRVRGGWFSSRADAKAICDELVRRNVGCIVATP